VAYRALLLRYVLGSGAVLCVPAAVVLYLFISAASDAGALQSARACSTGSRAPTSSCLSLFAGRITARTEHYRAPTELTIETDGSTIHVGYDCADSIPGACTDLTFQPGTHAVTEWWRGQIVMLGPPGSMPAVLTDQNPGYLLHSRAGYLAFAIPGISLVLFGLLLWQAPADAGELVTKAIAWSRNPTPLGRLLIWRVAWGSWIWTGGFVWFLLYVAGLVYIVKSAQYAAAALIWLCCGVLAFAASGIAASIYLTYRIRRAESLPSPGFQE
jgi:hypothetical protein